MEIWLLLNIVILFDICVGSGIEYPERSSRHPLNPSRML